MAGPAPGSYLVVCDGTNTYAMRTPEEIRAYFDGLEFVEPGLIDVTRWHPDPDAGDVPVLHNLVGVARKP